MAGNQDLFLVQSQFDELAAMHGKTAIWQAAYKCSCWTVQNGGSGGPTYSCAACNGTGYIYQPAVNAKVVLTGIDVKRDFLPAGVWQTGDITASIPYLQPVYTEESDGNIETWEPHPLWSIGIGDTLSLRDSEQRSSSILVRGQKLWRWEADTLPYAPDNVLNVQNLLVADPTSGEVTYYAQGVNDVDYTVSGGLVTWSAGSTADYMLNGNVIDFNPNGTYAKNMQAGTQYSVTYSHFATYVVYVDLPVPRDQDGQHMPRKVVLRLKDVGIQ